MTDTNATPPARKQVDPALAARFDGDVVYVPGDAPRKLRDAFGCFATGVTLITSRPAGGAASGCTVSSLASVSLDPPLLLFSLGLGSGMLATIRSNGQFGVNILASTHEHLSAEFCGPIESRFATDDWVDGQYGMPVLAGAVASFQCRLWAEYPGGDHAILVGAVQRARYIAQHDPLLFFGGAYRELSPR